MRHYKKGRKLGTDISHTKAMKRSLVTSLLMNDRIKTVESRAKEIRPDVDKIITWAKKGDLHSRRLAIAALGGNKEIVREIFEKVAQGMFQSLLLLRSGHTAVRKRTAQPVDVLLQRRKHRVELFAVDLLQRGGLFGQNLPRQLPELGTHGVGTLLRGAHGIHQGLQTRLCRAGIRQLGLQLPQTGLQAENPCKQADGQPAKYGHECHHCFIFTLSSYRSLRRSRRLRTLP